MTPKPLGQSVQLLAILSRLAILATGLVPDFAFAQAPGLVWREAGANFDPASAIPMNDDGLSGDSQAGDGLFSVRLTLPATASPAAARTVEYRIIPPAGVLADGLGAAGGGPMRLNFPDGSTRALTLFYGDAASSTEPLRPGCQDAQRVLACKGFAPLPSVGDSWNGQPSYGVIGDLQASLGGAAFDATSPLGTFSTGAGGAAGLRELWLGALPLSGGWRVASSSGGPSLGADGWFFDPLAGAGTGNDYSIDFPAWTLVQFELYPKRGAARVVPSDDPVYAPLITEIVFDPLAGFIEIVNPNNAPLSLAEIFLGDDPAYPSLADSPATASAGDFLVRFPAGAALAPHAYATIALGTAAAFQSRYSVAPDFVLGALPEAAAGSVDAAPSLDPAGEFVVLGAFQSGDPRVADLDLVSWGSPVSGDALPDKTGISVGGQSYGDDAMTQLSATAPIGPGIERVDFSEGAELQDPAANGASIPGISDRDDETSEALNLSFVASTLPTPGGPSPVGHYRLSGQIRRTQTGAPLSGVAIDLQPSGQSVTSDAAGRYRVDLDQGIYAPQLHLYHYEDLVLPAVTLAGQNQILDAEMQRLPGVRIAGRVDRLDGRPLAGARVVAQDRPGQESTVTTTSAVDGSFAFLDLSVGQAPAQPGSPRSQIYRINASKAGFDAVGTSLTVDSQNVTGVVLTLTPIQTGFDLSGQVVDSEGGQGLQGAAISIADLGAVTTTDAAGMFKLALVPAGTWVIDAGAQNYAPSSVQVQVVDAAQTGLLIPLVRSSKALVLRGRITASNLGLPVAGAEIQLEGASGLPQITHSDNLGAYVFGGVATGSYHFHVSAPGFTDYDDPALDVAATMTLDVPLEQISGGGFLLKGTVQLQGKGQGSWNGSVVVISGPSGKRDHTKSDGSFEFLKLPLGVYRMTASHDGYESASLEIPVAGDTTQDFILQISPQTAGGLSSCLGCVGVTGGDALWSFGLLLLLYFRARRRPVA